MPLAPIGAGAIAAPAAAPAPASPQAGFASALAKARSHAGPTQAAASRNPLVAALGEVERAQRRLDAVLEAARSGRTFTAGELLGLQAQAYRYSQTVDLASKLVEQAAQSVKQAANTQL